MLKLQALAALVLETALGEEIHSHRKAVFVSQSVSA
jgi:hypothetical protein